MPPRAKRPRGDTQQTGGQRRASASPTRRRLRVAAWAVAAVLVMLPWLTMQFTDEVQWTLFDFLLFGAILGGAGVAYEVAVRATRITEHRAAAALALATAAFLVLSNGAVGLIGSEDNDANLLYGGVLLVLLVGGAVTHLRAAGMARVLVAAALTQVLVPLVAAVADFGYAGPVKAWDVVMGTACFVALWLISAGLFWRTARIQAAVAGPRNAARTSR